MTTAVEVDGLVKEFRQRDGSVLRAVDGISFTVQEGEIFGFLGPNGAGKTTSLEMIEGLQRPTQGSARVLGYDSATQAQELKRHIGIQLQASAYFEYLTLREILELFGSFYPRRLEPDDLLDRVGLTGKAGALVRQLSGGQQQRFSIVASIVNDPQVVFLDEATTGLDPRARRDIWELIRSIRASGKTVVLSTHYMEEAETLCDRVAIIDRGRIVALDTPAGLTQGLSASYRVVFETDAELALEQLSELPGVVSAQRSARAPNSYELQIEKVAETLPDLLRSMKRARRRVDDLRVMPATLEDVFLARTGRGLQADEEPGQAEA